MIEKVIYLLAFCMVGYFVYKNWKFFFYYMLRIENFVSKIVPKVYKVIYKYDTHYLVVVGIIGVMGAFYYSYLVYKLIIQ